MSSRTDNGPNVAPFPVREVSVPAAETGGGRSTSPALAALAGLRPNLKEADVHVLLQRLAEAYGLPHYAIFILAPYAEDRNQLKLVLSNWQPRFAKTCEKHGLLRYSPVVRALESDPAPLNWDLEMLFGASSGDPAIDFLNENGFQAGVYYPVQGFSSVEGVVAFAGARDILEEEAVDDLYPAALAVFGAFTACRFEENRRNNPLSKRERECLRLAMLGKTSHEIGKILSLSEHTVSQYMNSAARKVNAVNRTHAVAVAAQLGYLS